MDTFTNNNLSVPTLNGKKVAVVNPIKKSSTPQESSDDDDNQYEMDTVEFIPLAEASDEASHSESEALDEQRLISSTVAKSDEDLAQQSTSTGASSEPDANRINGKKRRLKTYSLFEQTLRMKKLRLQSEDESGESSSPVGIGAQRKLVRMKSDSDDFSTSSSDFSDCDPESTELHGYTCSCSHCIKIFASLTESSDDSCTECPTNTPQSSQTKNEEHEPNVVTEDSADADNEDNGGSQQSNNTSGCSEIESESSCDARSIDIDTSTADEDKNTDEDEECELLSYKEDKIAF